MQKLFAQLNAITLMSSGLEEHLRRILKRYVFKKNEIILRKGQVCKHIRFIESGVICIHQTMSNKEVTVWIQKESEIFISVKSFFDQIPSKAAIRALEKCITWCITHEELEETCRLFPEFLVHYKKIETAYYQISEDRKALLLGLNPRERYDWLMNTDSQIFQRVPFEYIYSYLGISRETFYQIRKENAHARRKGK